MLTCELSSTKASTIHLVFHALPSVSNYTMWKSRRSASLLHFCLWMESTMYLHSMVGVRAVVVRERHIACSTNCVFQLVRHVNLNFWLSRGPQSIFFCFISSRLNLLITSFLDSLKPGMVSWPLCHGCIHVMACIDCRVLDAAKTPIGELAQAMEAKLTNDKLWSEVKETRSKCGSCEIMHQWSCLWCSF